MQERKDEAKRLFIETMRLKPEKMGHWDEKTIAEINGNLKMFTKRMLAERETGLANEYERISSILDYLIEVGEGDRLLFE